MAKGIKKAIPNVFRKLIDKIPELLSSKLSKNEVRGDGQLSESSPRAQVPAEMSSPSSSTGSDSSQKQHLESEEQGNCWINPSVKDKFLQAKNLEARYYFVSCNKSEKDEDDTLEQNWGGAFPKILFKSQLTESSKIDIKAKISEEEDQDYGEDYDFVFEFESDKFNNEYPKIIGEFNYENEEEKIASNNKGAIVKLTKPKNIEDKIYLLIGLDENSE